MHLGSVAKFPSALAESGRGWNTENPSQPNPGARADGAKGVKLPYFMLMAMFNLLLPWLLILNLHYEDILRPL